MGEEGKVVSFLKGFTDWAFAGHLLWPREIRSRPDRFLSILETVQRHMWQLQACLDKQESRTTTGTEMSQHLVTNNRTRQERTDGMSWTANQPICVCCKGVGHYANVPLYQARLQGATNSSTVTILYIARYCWRAGPCPTRYLCCQITHGWKINI